MFSTVRITKEGWLFDIDTDDVSPTLAPFYFVWNEPFKSLWEIGFIQGMDAATPKDEEGEKAKNLGKSKEWRGRRDSNSRPPA